MSTHRCIGIFTAGLDDEYQANLWHAMEQEASRRSLGTISFIGSRLGSPIASEASSNLAYHLASQHNIDGHRHQRIWRSRGPRLSGDRWSLHLPPLDRKGCLGHR
ncbi:MAG: hypothetical protein ACOXZ7_08105 [Sphaerochaeta sp.]